MFRFIFKLTSTVIQSYIYSYIESLFQPVQVYNEKISRFHQ